MLRKLDDQAALAQVAEWLSDEENYRWLDFGIGCAGPSPQLLKVMNQKDGHDMRLFFADDDGSEPAGVVGLSEIDRHFRTATFWVVLGDKRFARRGLATRASTAMLDVGFRDRGLGAIKTWVVDGNKPSLRLMDRLGFRFAGRLRKCHYICDQPHDRLFFDMLVNEYDARLAS